MPRKALYKDEAFQKLKQGAYKLAHATVETLGPLGKNVVIESGGIPLVTKDGVSVARHFDLEDPVERMGASLVRQAASKTNENVGDGTTTATLLACSIIDACEGQLSRKWYQFWKEKKDVYQLVKEMREYADQVSNHLTSQSVPCETLEMLTHVATISANNDPETGKLVAEIVHKIGKEGVVTVEESSGTQTETEHVEGTQLPNGFASPYMATNDKGECVLTDVHVLVTDRRISTIADMMPVLKALHEAKINKLVIVAEEVEGDALATLVVNKVQGVFTSLAVKAPLYGTFRSESLKDLAALMGAVFISDEAGRKLDSVKIEDLGHVKKVISTKDKTTFIGGKSDKAQVEARIKELRQDIKDEPSTFDREKKSERLARLTSGVALIRVGGYTESEMKEKKYLIEDAVCATKAALEDGILPGGGSALLLASQTVPESFISDCLEAPIKAISKNPSVCHEVKKMLGYNQNAGYDAKTGSYSIDLIASGIVDPTKVVKNTLQNAVSVASTFLTTSCVLYDEKK